MTRISTGKLYSKKFPIKGPPIEIIIRTKISLGFFRAFSWTLS
jgi:hypothetical protein